MKTQHEEAWPAMAPRITAAVAFDPADSKFGVDAPHLLVFFEDRGARVFSLAPYLDFGPFKHLLESGAFGRLHIVNDGGGIAWESGADVSAETLYAEGRPVKAWVTASSGTPDATTAPL